MNVPDLRQLVDDAADRVPAPKRSRLDDVLKAGRARRVAHRAIAAGVVAVLAMASTGVWLELSNRASPTRGFAANAPSTTVHSSIPSTSTTTRPLEAEVGTAAGAKVPWLAVRVSSNGRELAITYPSSCGEAARGAGAVMTAELVVVTVYAALSSGVLPLGCPVTTAPSEALTLPKPLGNRTVIDGAWNPDPNPYVVWNHPELLDGGLSVRVHFTDTTCTDVSSAAVVETTTSVTVTVSQGDVTPPTACRHGESSLTQEVQLASPLGNRRLVDGGCIDSPNNPACKTTAP
jgi:hypothetical protein